jgi:hypothetical protein
MSTVEYPNIVRPRLDAKPTVDHNGGMTREDPPLRIRLPEALKAKVQALAAENHRSMNAEIVSRLEWSIAHGDMSLNRKPLPAASTVSLEQDVAELQEIVGNLKSEFQGIREQVAGIDTRTQHLLPGRKNSGRE